ncbi:hypothetical protein K8942_06085 [Candidatus Peribacteria bacterium]|nr:MAG: hypothetical protein K8942_06085 [Candidatus Peribacteria bacterium]
MDTLFITLAAAIAVTLLSEGVLWWIFRQKLTPLVFPHELDTSYFRFFSMRRLRIAAALHTLMVATCIAICISLLW